MAAAVSEHCKNWCVCSGMLFYGWLISKEKRDFQFFGGFMFLTRKSNNSSLRFLGFVILSLHLDIVFVCTHAIILLGGFIEQS
jgi:hypothetical protein